MNKKYTENDMSEWLKQGGAECLRIKQTSHKDATNKSFKICVKLTDFEKVMSPEFWGEGIKCREWIR